MIHKFRKRHNASREDLFQESWLAYEKAKVKYDPDMGSSFLNYYTYWLTNRFQKFAKVYKDKIKIPDELKNKKKYCEGFIYLDPIFINKQNAEYDKMKSPEDQFEKVDNEMDESKALMRFQSILRPIEFIIVQNHYGFLCDVMTMSDIGIVLNLSRERIRQIRNKALKKIIRFEKIRVAIPHDPKNGII